MKLIDISTPKHPNTFTMVDDSDFDWLNQWKWSAKVDKRTIYARRDKVINGSRVSVSMHREILSPPECALVDHEDGNGLNNQRSNIRMATILENNRNRLSGRNKSGYLGVCWDKRDKSWRVMIKTSGKRIYIIQTKNLIEAAKARDAAAIKYFGAFAKLNFPINTQEVSI